MNAPSDFEAKLLKASATDAISSLTQAGARAPALVEA